MGMDWDAFEELEDLIDTSNAFGVAQERYVNKSEWAAAIAGTSDRKSKAYKAAQRNVERWTTQGSERRKPSKAALEKLAGLLKQDEQALELVIEGDEIEGVDVDFAGEITVSNDTRYRPGIAFTLTPLETARLVKALNEGKPGEANTIFWKAYGIKEHVEVSSGAELQIEVLR